MRLVARSHPKTPAVEPETGGGALREIRILLAAALFGVVVLPFLIWGGGRLLLGEYQRDPLSPEAGGPLALWVDYLQGLAHGNPGYWLACTGLYLVYLAVRLARRLLRV